MDVNKEKKVEDKKKYNKNEDKSGFKNIMGETIYVTEEERLSGVPSLSTDEIREFLDNGVPEGFWEKHPEKHQIWKDAKLDEITKEDLAKPPDWLDKINEYEPVSDQTDWFN